MKSITKSLLRTCADPAGSPRRSDDGRRDVDRLPQLVAWGESIHGTQSAAVAGAASTTTGLLPVRSAANTGRRPPFWRLR